MKTSLKLSNLEKFFDDFTPTLEGHSTPSEMLVELEKRVKDVKHYVDLDEFESINYKEDGYALFEVVLFDSDIYGNKVVTFKYTGTAS